LGELAGCVKEYSYFSPAMGMEVMTAELLAAVSVVILFASIMFETRQPFHGSVDDRASFYELTMNRIPV
jgi:hypothetical protein